MATAFCPYCDKEIGQKVQSSWEAEDYWEIYSNFKCPECGAWFDVEVSMEPVFRAKKPKEQEKDWSKLTLEFEQDGTVRLYDGASRKTLLSFYSTRRVYRHIDAQGGNGKFDDRGRIIIE